MLNIFKSKMALVADVFPNIRNLKNVVTSISKKSCFRSPFEKQDIKRDQKLLKVERHDKHYLLNRDNLTQPIQMHLYQKQKNFLKFFPQRLKSSLNFEHFEAKEYRDT